MNNFDFEAFVKNAVQEDIGSGDHTSLACIPENLEKKATLFCKEQGVLAGIDIAERIFKFIDPTLNTHFFLKDGADIKPGDIAYEVTGNARSILKAERLVLNCMQRMSGIATSTKRMTKMVAGTNVRILDTRKTTPGFRALEKQAVKIGGGQNHRFGLYDMIMIKDNHIDCSGGIVNAIQTTRKYLSENNLPLKIEIEARNLTEVREILKEGGVDRIMLDNFSTEDMVTAVKEIDGNYETEASGGITEASIKKYAECGVDFISIGALTHHVKSLDMSLKTN